jgi:type I restriction enzyme M protein
MTTSLHDMQAALPLDRRHFNYEADIRRLHDHLYGNANVRTPEGIAGEVVKVLKTLIHNGHQFTELPTSGLSALSDLDEHTAATVAAELQDAFTSMNAEVRAYPASERLGLDDSSLLAVRLQLNGIDMSMSGRDWLGDAIEIFRSLTAKRVGGQFFTHPLVTQLAMELLEFDPTSGDDLVDICAGTGGFLLAGSRVIADEGAAYGGCLRGAEVDPELVRFANANLAMHLGCGGEFVFAADSLASPERWPASLRRTIIPGTHQCLASNPPFGTKITVKDQAVLRQYDLAGRWQKQDGQWEMRPGRLSPRPPDLLFIERNLRLAEPGCGRVALVTPYQVLSGPQSGFVREWLMRHARVRAIVDLPATTFQPHTGTKTALMVLERRIEPLDRWDPNEDYPIFMAVADHIGHDRRGNPQFDGQDASHVRTDIPDVAAAFAAFRNDRDPSEEFADAFVVRSADVNPLSDLRLNAAFHRPATTRLRHGLQEAAAKRGWTVVPLGEVTERVFFPPRFKRDYVEPDQGIPFLSGTNISQVTPTGAKFLAPDDERAQACVVRAGWILVTRSGSTGVVSSVPEAWDGFAVSDHVIRVVPDPRKLDPGYVEAYLRSPAGQALLRSGIFGSVIDEITPEHVESIPIPVPNDASEIAAVAASMRAVVEARTVASAEILNADRHLRALIDG